MRIGLDAMGGDRGIDVVVPGAIRACQILAEEDVIVLVGDEGEIRQRMNGANVSGKIEIVHTDQVIGMAESPVEAMRTKPKSSIALLASLQKEGQLDASISAGNTGACVAAAQMRLGRLSGVQRPGIAVLAPTFHGPVAICDVGANVNCRPQHLHQYAVMASLYMKAVANIESPRVGLLSIGEEATKGNDLVKNTSKLLTEDETVNFIGNVEGRDLLTGICDVMVCEGFVGNVVLKLIEGMGYGWMKTVIQKFALAMPDQMDRVKQVAMELRQQYDYNEYGGAPLLGVDGIFMICHGATDENGIANAVRSAKNVAAHKVNEHITDRLSEE